MDMTLRPGDFPLGSLESRAAVRAMIERERCEDSRPILRVYVVGHPPEDCKGTGCLKPLDIEANGGRNGDGVVMGNLSPGACKLVTGELVVFPNGGVGFDSAMNLGGNHGRA
jgi:hypothetical protein